MFTMGQCPERGRECVNISNTHTHNTQHTLTHKTHTQHTPTTHTLLFLNLFHILSFSFQLSHFFVSFFRPFYVFSFTLQQMFFLFSFPLFLLIYFRFCFALTTFIFLYVEYAFLLWCPLTTLLSSFFLPFPLPLFQLLLPIFSLFPWYFPLPFSSSFFFSPTFLLL